MRYEEERVNVGIGFVTGRKNFKNVLKAYLSNWNKSNFPDASKYMLHLFVAYDLKYTGTNIKDYNIVEDDILRDMGSTLYIDDTLIADEAKKLSKKKIASLKELKLIFGEGYAMKRNAVLYFALKSKMDCLIFLDDDEYPIANIQAEGNLLWKGQEVLTTHIQNIPFADITHGHHCGYISPIPYMKFNETFSEDDFRMLIEAVSNDIVTWDSVRKKMEDGGITYADSDVIESTKTELVKEVGGMKFISGANLGLNLKNPAKIYPFYNPPNARGEDTFLSTCIGTCKIRKVPCYTFHDGFLAYQQLLSGDLPDSLHPINITSAANYERFLKASIGWIRYKPLLLLITHKNNYKKEIADIRRKLKLVLPKICAYFGNKDFMVLLKELDFYDHHVYEHYRDFEDTKNVWLKIVSFLTGYQTSDKKKK